MFAAHICAAQAREIIEHIMAWTGDVLDAWLGHPPRQLLPAEIVSPEPSDTYCPRCGAMLPGILQEEAGAGRAEGRGHDQAEAWEKSAFTECGSCTSCSGRDAIADLVIRVGEHRGLLRERVLALKHDPSDWRNARALQAALGEAVRHALHADRASRGAYRDHDVDDADEGDHDPGADPAAGLLAGPGAEGRFRRGGAPPRDIVVIPVPMPLPRRVLRGVDHTELLAAGVARAVGGRVMRPYRRRSGPRQAGFSTVQQRITRGGKGFVLRGTTASWRARLRGTLVIVVDDVLTTGTTARRLVQRIRRLHPSTIWVAAVTVRSWQHGRGAGSLRAGAAKKC